MRLTFRSGWQTTGIDKATEAVLIPGKEIDEGWGGG